MYSVYLGSDSGLRFGVQGPPGPPGPPGPASGSLTVSALITMLQSESSLFPSWITESQIQINPLCL